MSKAFLFGAGASFDAGIPMSFGLTKTIVSQQENAVKNGSADPNHQVVGNDEAGQNLLARDILYFVLGVLVLKRGEERVNPLDSTIDVEELFSALVHLRDRHNSEGYSFVHQWHPKVTDFERRSGFQGDLIRKVLFEFAGQAAGTAPTAEVDGTVDRQRQAAGAAQAGPLFVVSQLQEILKLYEQSLNRDDSIGVAERRKTEAFSDTCDILLHRLSELVWIDRASEIERVEYLRTFCKYLLDQEPTMVATLNYDNTLEVAADTEGLVLNTCAVEWSQKKTISMPEKGCMYLKLHGSIDWYFKRGDGAFEYETILTEGKPFHKNAPYTSVRYYMEPGIIFGARNKLRAVGPFLDLLMAFRDGLRNCNELIIVGYSFRDEHINVIVKRWYENQEGVRLTVVSPSIQDKTPDFLVALDQSRLTLEQSGAKDYFARLA